MEEKLAIVSHIHDRIVFCQLADYRERHKNAHLIVYYHYLTKQGNLRKRELKLPLDCEGVKWEVREEHLHLL